MHSGYTFYHTFYGSSNPLSINESDSYTIKIGNHEYNELQFFERENHYSSGWIIIGTDIDFDNTNIFPDYPFMFGYYPGNPQVDLYIDFFLMRELGDNFQFELINEST
jgi:hypothetical protein